MMPLRRLRPTFPASLLAPWLALCMYGLAQAAPPQHIDGCWQTIRNENHTLEGKVVTVQGSCWSWYADMSRTQVCKDAKGALSLPLSSPYTMTEAGELMFYVGQPPMAYRIEGDRLTMTTRPRKPIQLEDGHTYSHFIRIAERRPAKSMDACLPKRSTVSQEEHLKHYRVADMVLRTVLEQVLQSYAMSTLWRNGTLSFIDRSAWRDADMRKALTELTRIAEDVAREHTRPLRENPEQLQASFFSQRGCANQVDARLASERVQTWATQSIQTLSAIMAIHAQWMAWQALENKSPLNSYPAPEAPGGPDPTSLKNLASLIPADDSDNEDAARFTTVLPDGEELAALRKRARLLDEQAREYQVGLDNACLHKGVQQTLRSLENLPGGKQNIQKAWQRGEDEAQLLVRRMAALARSQDKRTCQLASDIDAHSIAKARGDWTQVRTRQGKPITGTPPALFTLHQFLESKCPGANDVPAARRVLEGIVALQSNDFKPWHAAACKLAQWQRYGIGGKVDQAAADALLDHAKTRSGTACFVAPFPPVDPADPWRVLAWPDGRAR